MTEPTPAGWYADPYNANQQRFWDGAAWAQETRVFPPPPMPPAATVVYMPNGDVLPAPTQAPAPMSPPQWPAQPTWPAQQYRQPMPPQNPMLATRSYSAPISFVGSTRRMTGWARQVNSRSGASAAAWAIVCCVLPFAWLFVAGWYVVVFGIFGLFTVPYRLVRRGQRKNTHLAQAHLAATQAMLYQQQQGQQPWR